MSERKYNWRSLVASLGKTAEQNNRILEEAEKSLAEERKAVEDYDKRIALSEGYDYLIKTYRHAQDEEREHARLLEETIGRLRKDIEADKTAG